MLRKLTSELLEWKNSQYRQPLILQGARQVGKTYAVLEFAREQYDNTAYINFEFDSGAQAIFEGSLNPKEIIAKTELFTQQTISKGRTLLFFDEIQRCPPALTSLKYFAEFAPEYHVITAGSLLGVAVSRDDYSFPVGKVDRLTLFPMDFEEFLLAMGKPDLADRIRSCFVSNAPMDIAYHNALLELYRQYLVVGGMPDCVAKFIETGNYTLVRAAQKLIINDYLDDMSKYNSKSEIKKARLTYNSVTVQLSKKNTRFQYKLIKSGGRAAEFENAIEWLVLSGIVTRVYSLSTVKKPLENYKNIDSFKIFASDAGLLCAKNDILPNDIIFGSSELNDFKGGLTENYVCSELTSLGHKLYTWHSNGEAEIDFILQREGKLIPIEVKSADNSKAKSLRTYIGKFKPEYSIKASTNNFGFENGIKSIPLYAVFCIAP